MSQASVNQESAVVLLSGGLDSTVALAQTRESHDIFCCVTFEYGQRAWPQERKASQAICDHYGIPHRIIALPWLSELLPTGISSAGTESGTSVKSVWVPNRNGVFLNIASALAEASGSDRVVFGANLEEGTGFSDNSPEFTEAINQSLHYSTQNHVRVETPVGHLNKKEIVALGKTLNAPLFLIWSCYENGDSPCGQCLSCKLLQGIII